MADNEVQIGDKTIGENTKITLTVKVLAWALGGLFALISGLFSLAYFDIKSELENSKQKMETETTVLVEKVNSKLDELAIKFGEKDEEFLKDLGDIKGDIKVILDRTSRNYSPTAKQSGNFEGAVPQEDFKNNYPE